MKCFKYVLSTGGLCARKAWTKCYWCVFLLLAVMFFFHLVGGFVYGRMEKDLVEQRVNYLEQTGAGLAKEIGGQNVTFGNVKSLPAIIVNVSFDIPSNQIHLAEICKKVTDDGWRISFCDTKGQKMKFYNDVFVVDFCYEEKKKKGIIGITYNEVWTKMIWFRYWV